ncbi:hypothetical protein H072_4533 [Dactylellina haptotyla CBS 200.50]|uniref:Uncharacterized protein n=1 Tax=Dactylellina haptotyla (strain CBS 200.50) TaxID=1284197 RepID=S8AF40_DACHA|nr:hypothetical protein H072_4533 [Dactylellina haptotyla CBS 200.50]
MDPHINPDDLVSGLGLSVSSDVEISSMTGRIDDPNVLFDVPSKIAVPPMVLPSNSGTVKPEKTSVSQLTSTPILDTPSSRLLSSGGKLLCRNDQGLTNLNDGFSFKPQPFKCPENRDSSSTSLQGQKKATMPPPPIDTEIQHSSLLHSDFPPTPLPLSQRVSGELDSQAPESQRPLNADQPVYKNSSYANKCLTPVCEEEEIPSDPPLLRDVEETGSKAKPAPLDDPIIKFPKVVHDLTTSDFEDEDVTQTKERGNEMPTESSCNARVVDKLISTDLQSREKSRLQHHQNAHQDDSDDETIAGEPREALLESRSFYPGPSRLTEHPRNKRGRQSIPPNEPREPDPENEDEDDPMDLVSDQESWLRNDRPFDYGRRNGSLTRANRNFPPRPTRRRSIAVTTNRMDRGVPANDLDLVSEILNGKFRREQLLDEQLSMMQTAVMDIDEKLNIIVEKSHERSKLRERCQMFEDALHKHRDEGITHKEEIDKLGVKVLQYDSEIKLNRTEMEFRLARANDRQEQYLEVIRKLRTANEAHQEQFKELGEKQTQLNEDLEDVLTERTKLRVQMNDRDKLLENVMKELQTYKQKLEEHRIKYQDIADKCARADETAIMNKILRDDLERARNDLEQERVAVASLDETIKALTLELVKFKDTVDSNHRMATGQTNSVMNVCQQFISSQQINFDRYYQILTKIETNGEDPTSELFKNLKGISLDLDSKWSSLQTLLSGLLESQNKLSSDSSERAGKWEAIKSTMKDKIDDLVQRLDEQQCITRNISMEKNSLSVELSKQKELNLCLVDTTNSERALHESRMMALKGKLDNLESAHGDIIIKNTLLNSSLKTLEAKLEDERRNVETKKKLLSEANERYKEATGQLEGDYKRIADRLSETEKANSELDEAKKLITTLEAQLATEKLAMVQKVSELEGLTRELHIRDDKLGQAASRWTDISAKQSRLEAEVAAAKAEAQLRAEEAQSQRLEAEKSFTRSRNLEDDLIEKSKLLERCQAALEMAHAEAEGQKRRFDAQELALSRSQELRQALERDVQARDVKISELEKSLSESTDEERERLIFHLTKMLDIERRLTASLKSSLNDSDQPAKVIPPAPAKEHSPGAETSAAPALRRSSRNITGGRKGKEVEKVVKTEEPGTQEQAGEPEKPKEFENPDVPSKLGQPDKSGELGQPEASKKRRKAATSEVPEKPKLVVVSDDENKEQNQQKPAQVKKKKTFGVSKGGIGAKGKSKYMPKALQNPNPSDQDLAKIKEEVKKAKEGASAFAGLAAAYEAVKKSSQMEAQKPIFVFTGNGNAGGEAGLASASQCSNMSLVPATQYGGGGSSQQEEGGNKRQKQVHSNSSVEAMEPTVSSPQEDLLYDAAKRKTIMQVVNGSVTATRPSLTKRKAGATPLRNQQPIGEPAPGPSRKRARK